MIQGGFFLELDDDADRGKDRSRGVFDQSHLIPCRIVWIDLDRAISIPDRHKDRRLLGLEDSGIPSNPHRSLYNKKPHYFGAWFSQYSVGLKILVFSNSLILKSCEFPVVRKSAPLAEANSKNLLSLKSFST